MIKAGYGDRKYVFEEEEDGEIYGRCVRQHWFRYGSNKVTNTIGRFYSFVGTLLSLGGAGGFRSLE